MAYSYIGTGVSANGTTAITYTPTAGNLLIIVMFAGSGLGACWVTSITGSGTWATVAGALNASSNTVINVAGGYYQGIYYCLSAPSGGSQTFTLNTNVSPGARNVRILEYSGLTSFVNYTQQSLTTPGTGADSFTSGNVNVSTAPAMLFGYAAGINTSAQFTAGTSPTAFTSRVAGNEPSNNAALIFEDARILSSGNVAATMGNSSATQSGGIWGVAFAEPAAAASLPLAMFSQRRNQLFPIST
jgi:hypothetical protein